MGARWLRSVGDGDGWRDVHAYDEGGPPPVSWGDAAGECACDGCVADILSGLGQGRHGADWPSSSGGGGGGGAPGRLTEIALVDGHVVDVRTRPVQGSGYECAAYELEARGLLRPAAPPATITLREEPSEAMLDWLARVVGGEDALDALSAAPLPTDEELDLGAVPGWDRERARVIDEHVQTAAIHTLLGPEVLTACRRLLVRAAGTGILEVWREVRPQVVAAAVVHCVIKANDLTSDGQGLPLRAMLEGMDIRGYPTDRSRRLATLVAGPDWPHGRRPAGAPEVYVVGDADLLVSTYRRRLLRYRSLAERVCSAPS